jgi:AcrR family transcriptional regulator
MSTVTSATAHTSTGYHHGDLPNALRRAAVEVIEERGVGGFSLREVARRAGVSHTAPAHHFGDMKGLLTSVAEEGFDELHRASVEAIAGIDDPAERLDALGRAYVRLARSHRGHCEVMFRVDIVNTDDPELMECGIESYQVLESTVASLIEAEQLDVDLDDAAWFCWSTMQGLVQLEPKITLLAQLKGRDEVSTDDLIDRFMHLTLNGLRHA